MKLKRAIEFRLILLTALSFLKLSRFFAAVSERSRSKDSLPSFGIAWAERALLESLECMVIRYYDRWLSRSSGFAVAAGMFACSSVSTWLPVPAALLY